MTNSKEVLSGAISDAQRGLAMWGWDAAVPVMLEAGVKVEFCPTNTEQFPRLKPFWVQLTTRFWNGDPEDPTDRGVIFGSAYGLSVREAFIAALDDLASTLNQTQSLLTDIEVWAS